MFTPALPILVSLLLSSAEPLGFAAGGLERCSAARGELERGEVALIEQSPFGGKGVALTACAIVDAAPARVWPVLRDCQSYSAFLPGVAESRLFGREGNIARCEALIRLPFPFGEWKSLERATETTRIDGGFDRRWTLESGTYRRLEGLWTLLPWGDGGSRTLLIYQLDMDPNTMIPDFVLRRVQSATAPEVFDAIRARTRQCEADHSC